MPKRPYDQRKLNRARRLVVIFMTLLILAMLFFAGLSIYLNQELKECQSQLRPSTLLLLPDSEPVCSSPPEALWPLHTSTDR